MQKIQGTTKKLFLVFGRSEETRGAVPHEQIRLCSASPRVVRASSRNFSLQK
jgi:hypothetical protein